MEWYKCIVGLFHTLMFIGKKCYLQSSFKNIKIKK